MNRRKRHSNIWLYFAGIVFATIVVVFFLVTAVWLVLYALDIISIDPHGRRIPLLVFFCGSLLLGGALAVFVGKVIIRPIQQIGAAFTELSSGNFDVRVPVQGPIAEIREIARQFNAMTYDLAHIETLRTDFVANVSHECKTPISSIEGYATLLQNPSLTPTKHEYYVNKILENSRRLSKLFSSMLLLSKLENQEMVLNQKEFRLDEQIRRVILLLEESWAKKNIQFDMELPRQMLYGSEALLEQVWGNIIDNAIKYSPENGVIGIRMADTEDWLTVSITDHGEGMTAEVQKHIFEKCYQGDPSHKAEGNGLGLALVKRIMDICHGTVTVESSVGQGTTFTISLPYQANEI